MTALPAGIRVGACTDTRERGAVRVDIDLDAERRTLALVMPPREARALGALLLKQADLVEQAERARGPLLRGLP